jgi:hypothetical protein
MFTTADTYEYFYNNDLRVLVDVFIRELYDLPDDAEAVNRPHHLSHPLARSNLEGFVVTTYIPSRPPSAVITYSTPSSTTLQIRTIKYPACPTFRNKIPNTTLPSNRSDDETTRDEMYQSPLVMRQGTHDDSNDVVGCICQCHAIWRQ